MDLSKPNFRVTKKMSQDGATEENSSLVPEVATPMAFPLGLRMICGVLTYVNDFARKKDGTFNRWIMNLIEYKSPPNPTPDRGVYTKDVIVEPGTGVWVRLFVPEDAGSKREDEVTAENSLPIVFFFHGGGFATLSPDFMLYDVFCRRVARRRRAVVVSVDYRRSPEHRCPIAYEDCFAAIRWVGSHEGRSHLPPSADVSRCYLMGDSAGGNIVHHVGCKILGEDISPLRIVGHVLIQPFFGGEERTPSEVRLVGAPIINMENSDWHWRAFLPEGASRDHPACNVFGPSAPDISHLPLPPTLVVVGGHDPLQDWQLRYVDYLRNMNKNVRLLFYAEAIHGFHIFPQVQVSSKLISNLDAFFTECGK